MAFRSHYQLKHYDNDICFPAKEQVINAMIPYLHDRASDGRYIHQKGKICKDLEEQAKEVLASQCGFSKDEVFFTSGVTESNNLAMNIVLSGKPKIAYLATERSSIVRFIIETGKPSIKIPVNKTGIILLDQLTQILEHNKDVGLVTVGYANHETGTLQPMSEILRICKKAGVLVHTDASTAFGKIEIDLSAFDMVSLSSRNIGGPSGVASILVKTGLSIKPLLIGDSNPNALKGGNIPVSLVAGYKKSLELILIDKRINKEISDNISSLVSVLKNYKMDTVNSDNTRLPSYLNISVPCDADKLIERMESEYAVAISKGYLGKESRVLKEQGVDSEGRKNCIRLSFPVIHDSERGNFVHDLVRCIKEIQRS
jgi:cysteine desulfurase